jgi:hypothetical protein
MPSLDGLGPRFTPAQRSDERERTVKSIPQPAITRLAEKLAVSRWGRVLMHFRCLAAHPLHLRWHWHGIVREWARSS